MKSMIVTGAANGIGRAIAQGADLAGYRVGVLDIVREHAEATAAQLSHGEPLVCDVTNAELIARQFEQFGNIDVLVNNAGILRTGPLIDHEPDDFRLVIETNLNAVFVAAQAAARIMRDHGGGCIVNIASIVGMHPSPNSGAYAAAKGGVISLTQHMSLEWGAYGIRVNAVAPGFIDAGMSAPFYGDPVVRERRSSAVPIGRLGSEEDVVKAVLFLASDDADYISGETVAVDGGVINSVLMHLPRD